MKISKKLKYVLGSFTLVGLSMIPLSVGLVSCSNDDNSIDQDMNDQLNIDDNIVENPDQDMNDQPNIDDNVVENPEQNLEDQKLKLDFL